MTAPTFKDFTPFWVRDVGGETTVIRANERTGTFVFNPIETTGTIRWCRTHDLPYSKVRTGNDRMVCWWIWWTEAMDRSTPGPTHGEQLPCVPIEAAVYYSKATP